MALKVMVEKFKAHQCQAVGVCPVGALTQKDQNSPPVVDSSKCIECGLCVSSCTNGELLLEE